jgi:Cu-Zn family superoxide dismutase
MAGDRRSELQDERRFTAGLIKADSPKLAEQSRNLAYPLWRHACVTYDGLAGVSVEFRDFAHWNGSFSAPGERAMKTTLSMLFAGMIALAACMLSAQETQPKKKASKAAAKIKTVTKEADHAHAHADHPLPTKAVCVLMPTKGNDVQGNFLLTQMGGGTEIIGEVRGLTPGKHGFHIHELGDLRSDDGTSAGGHYNPEGHKHGGPDDAERHVGDLGNITADESGKAMVKMTVRGLQVHFVVGRSLVVHAKEDDLKTQPSGDAGGRVAVGVIGIANGTPATAVPPSPAGKGAKKAGS